jgi:hypothetical protein
MAPVTFLLLATACGDDDKEPCNQPGAEKCGDEGIYYCEHGVWELQEGLQDGPCAPDPRRDGGKQPQLDAQVPVDPTLDASDAHTQSDGGSGDAQPALMSMDAAR